MLKRLSKELDAMSLEKQRIQKDVDELTLRFLDLLEKMKKMRKDLNVLMREAGVREARGKKRVGDEASQLK